MLIHCPNCATGYDVSLAALGAAGRLVRCAGCQRKWFAAPSAPPPLSGTLAALPSRQLIPAAAGAVHPVGAAAPAEDEPAAAPGPGADDDAAGSWGVPEIAAPPLAPDTIDIKAGASPLPQQDIETLAALRVSGARRVARRRSGRTALPVLPTVIVAQLVALGGFVAWRSEIVHALPGTASLFRAIGLPVNLRGVAFSDIRTSKDIHDGVTVLIVEGAIGNTTRSAVSVPRLRFSLRNRALAELLSWTVPPENATLGPGETLAFRSRLASPPADGNDVLVRFLNRQDFINGAH
jgi:predicted Zn finger-like uncharacterized protein